MRADNTNHLITAARRRHELTRSKQRSTDASLLRRLEAANGRNRELAADNQRLRHQLAQALGQRRATAPHNARQQPDPQPAVALR